MPKHLESIHLVEGIWFKDDEERKSITKYSEVGEEDEDWRSGLTFLGWHMKNTKIDEETVIFDVFRVREGNE